MTARPLSPSSRVKVVAALLASKTSIGETLDDLLDSSTVGGRAARKAGAALDPEGLRHAKPYRAALQKIEVALRELAQ